MADVGVAGEDFTGGGGGSSSSFNFGAGVSVAGDVLGGFGAFEAGQSTAAADRAKARGFGLESTAYTQAAGYAQGNVDLAEEAKAIKNYQTMRHVAAVEGSQKAAVGGAGFAESGTALSLLKDSAAQGALASGLVNVQGEIQAQGYRAQQASDLALSNEALNAQAAAKHAASAAEDQGIFGLIGGIAKGGIAALPLLGL